MSKDIVLFREVLIIQQLPIIDLSTSQFLKSTCTNFFNLVKIHTFMCLYVYWERNSSKNRHTYPRTAPNSF